MKKQNYNTTINAPKEKVWELLWGQTSYPEWTAAFAEGSSVETDWQEGSKAIFGDGKGDGMIARIAKRTENEFLSIEHLGMLLKGEEIMDGPKVDSWKGAHENYTLSETNGITTLNVDMDVTDDMQEYFNKTWPKALEKLKAMAER